MQRKNMTGIEPYLPTLVKLGGTIIVRSVPTGLEYLQSFWKGKTILIVGQSRAGKTTFLEYFQYGLFEDEKETQRTYEETPTARFNVKLGRDQSLEIIVKKTIDIDGHSAPFQQAKLIIEQKPHALLIFMDATLPLKTSTDWLTEFCKKLESHWRVKGIKKNRIKSIVLVLNKKDKVEAKTMSAKTKSFKKILDSELKDSRGKMLDDVVIITTVMVNNPDGTKSADGLISSLAKSLIK
jgi:GTPase SAR1 family protein